MTSYQGIQDTKKDILGNNKIQKVKFEDRLESIEPEAKEIKTDKKVSPKDNKKINSLAVKNLERRKASKNQVTAVPGLT